MLITSVSLHLIKSICNRLKSIEIDSSVAFAGLNDICIIMILLRGGKERESDVMERSDNLWETGPIAWQLMGDPPGRDPHKNQQINKFSLLWRTFSMMKLVGSVPLSTRNCKSPIEWERRVFVWFEFQPFQIWIDGAK